MWGGQWPSVGWTVAMGWGGQWSTVVSVSETLNNVTPVAPTLALITFLEMG